MDHQGGGPPPPGKRLSVWAMVHPSQRPIGPKNRFQSFGYGAGSKQLSGGDQAGKQHPHIDLTASGTKGKEEDVGRESHQPGDGSQVQPRQGEALGNGCVTTAQQPSPGIKRAPIQAPRSSSPHASAHEQPDPKRVKREGEQDLQGKAAQVRRLQGLGKIPGKLGGGLGGLSSSKPGGGPLQSNAGLPLRGTFSQQVRQAALGSVICAAAL